MNALVAKEFRLLRPAFAVALLLAVVPSQLLGNEHDSDLMMGAFFAFCFGLLLLALSAFGREFAMNTFGLLMAQPLQRTRIWWTKISILGAAVTIVFLAWTLALWPQIYFGNDGKEFQDLLPMGAMAAAVIFSGGLWTTLLLRQVAAAFWFTLLLPISLLMFLGMRESSPPTVYTALSLYSAAGFFWAWRHFRRIQETGWTGGEVAFPGRRTRVRRTPVPRGRRSFAALLHKEFQLHLVSLIGMAALFLLHLVVVWLRHFELERAHDVIHTGLQVFGGIWFVMPLLIGATAVAEERKLNTIDTLLTLPISRRIQFIVKLLFVLALGGFFCPLLAWSAEGLAALFRSSADVAMFREPFRLETLFYLSMIGCAISFVSFYASTLARSIIQSLAVAVTVIILVQMLGALALRPPHICGEWLWQGSLAILIFVPIIGLAFLWLAWKNFCSIAELAHLLWRNFLGWLSAVLLVIVLTTVLYHRAWEFFSPAEKDHGPAQIARSTSLIAKSQNFSSLCLLFPDGKLWVGRLTYDPGQLSACFGTSVLFHGIRWVASGNYPLGADSKWRDAVTTLGDMVAIRNDGTLWVTAKPWQFENESAADKPPERPLRFVQLGNETNWKAVIAEQGWSVLLIKTDGTLWQLGNPRQSSNNKPLSADTPQQVGQATDWDRGLFGTSRVYLWKKDGTSWALRLEDFRSSPGAAAGSPLPLDRLDAFDNTRWRGFGHFLNHQVGLRDDGTLWMWPTWPQYNPRAGKPAIFNPSPARIGEASDWLAISGCFASLAAIKTDGSLWRWNVEDRDMTSTRVLSTQPVRVSRHSDWVALGAMVEGTVSLAADGSLWYWEPNSRIYAPDSDITLKPSRKPRFLDNILTDR
jgi:ABC-type transport system involved in multi-copper enzyme maturation permease subunit